MIRIPEVRRLRLSFSGRGVNEGRKEGRKERRKEGRKEENEWIMAAEYELNRRGEHFHLEP